MYHPACLFFPLKTLKPESLGWFSTRCIGVLDDGPSSFVINKLCVFALDTISAVVLFGHLVTLAQRLKILGMDFFLGSRSQWMLPRGQTLSFRDTASDRLLTLQCLVTYLWAYGQSYLDSGSHSLKKTWL